MRRYLGVLGMLGVALLMAGCGGKGATAPAPANVAVVAKDSRIVVTWTSDPGVEYWIFKAVGSGVTPQNCSAMLYCSTSMGATSPATMLGLANGTTYSVSINGRTGGGPGGEGSPAVSATPRMAGETWTAGTAMPTGTLRAVAFGSTDGKFVAVGDSGALYSAPFSAEGSLTWTAQTNPVPAASLYAVNFDSSRARYLAAGAGGVILSMSPATSTDWTQMSNTVTTQDLYAIINDGAGFTLAAGASGTILTSSDGSTWTARTSGTTNALRAAAYGYDNTNLNLQYVVVGDSRTLLYSADGLNWTAGTCPSCVSTPNLNSVVYASSAGVFVAVGNGGVVLTSTDGITWAPQTSFTVANLNSVTYTTARRFVAVGGGGEIFYSESASLGATWTQATSPVATALHAITTDQLFDYLAVGASGSNLYAD